MIFCMNVLIYFSEERRRSLVQRFYDTRNWRLSVPGHSDVDLQDAVKFKPLY